MWLAGCSATFSPGSSGRVPVNDGPRLELVVSNVDDGWRGDETSALIRIAWAQDADLRSWFTLVDRVSNAGQTVYLNAQVGAYDRNTTRIGTPKHGYTYLNSVTANVTFELIDAQSGVVVAAGTGRASDSTSSGSPSQERALQRAIANGLRNVVRVYAGER